MSEDYQDYHSKYLSFDACEKAASFIRDRLGLNESEPIPEISGVLLKLNIDCVVHSEESMAGEEAYAIPKDAEIHCRQDVFERVLEDEADARFVILHEIAHCYVHDGQQRYFKMTDGNILLPFTSDEESSEKHADRIARAAHMPKQMINLCRSAFELAKRARVPHNEAITRWRDVNMPLSRSVPLGSQPGIAGLRVASAASKPAKRKAKVEMKKLQLWQSLPTIEGENPSSNRVCEGHWIKWDEFGKMTHCGWFIDGDQVKSWFAEFNR